MKVLSVHIYHFGVLQDCKLNLEPSNLQLLFGENEAGKTTLMDFMKCMLFGFPSRNQSKKRYEPKNGNRLGGKITVEHASLGRWTIERIEGAKVSGDISIYDETGQQKEEAFLTVLLDGMDQTLFEGAYCFGLDGLQKLDKLTSEELGNFLMSTAISGDRDLLEIEQTFEKKQGELFKKAGKKPVINEKMEQLKTIEQTLHEHRRKNENYQILNEKKEQLEKELKQIAVELSGFQKELGSFKRLFELQPVLEKYKQLKLQLKTFDADQMFFPENGIHRYEQCQEQLLGLNGELSYIDERLLSIEKEKDALSISDKLIQNQKEIKQLFNKLPEYEHLQKQLVEFDRSLSHIENEELGITEAIGETWRSNELQQLALTLSSLNDHEQMLKQMQNVQEKKRRLEEDLEDSRVKLEELEKEEAELKQILLPEEEYKRYEQEKNQKQRTVFPLWAAILPIISAVLLIWSGWTSPNTFVLSCGVLLLFTAIGITLYLSRNEKSDPGRTFQSNQKYLEDEVNRNQWIQLSAELSHANKLYLQLAKQLDFLELEEARIYDETVTWADKHGFTGDIDKLLVNGYVEHLYKLKELMRQKEKITQQVSDAATSSSVFEDAVVQLLSDFRIEPKADIKDAVQELNDSLQEQLKKMTEIEHLEKNQNELVQRKEALSKKSEHIKDQIGLLWKESCVKSEKDFYLKGEEVKSFFETTKEWEMTHNQLRSLGISDNGIESMAGQITSQYEETLQLMKSLEGKEEQWKNAYKTATEERAKLDWEMKKLLDDGSYSEHLHRYELLKEEWNQLVKKWAGYRLAQHALQVVKEHYQKTKLPAVLETSSVYFSKITEGEYKSIIFTSSNEMLLVKSDGTRFSPGELSRGTAEQVYLAIRLAVAMNAGPAGFPIFMDDIAVNFDEKRTRRTMSLIGDAAHDRQILFFTCHAHLHSIVPSVPLIHWPSHSILAEK
ncbi:AAA family ATPase [Bacillus sp. NEB1478]|uniref:ATP-binding protein n=1 Tax=Bacillus sp. NEB1478 TaxID=3073816 RepID=UPI002872AEB2|nr:AAA family ATPase [Bacillus sp. NEB1478]WNB91457.1 AAA family ATPase [Bacillus sp. NEB1478]